MSKGNPSSAKHWYYEFADGHRGPFTVETMRDLLLRGAISRDTLVWNAAFGESWKRLGDTGIEVGSDTASASPKQKGYLAKILQPGERVLTIGRLHWIIYKDAVIAAALSGAFFWMAASGRWSASEQIVQLFIVMSAFVLFFAAIGLAIRSWFEGWITEIAVTNQRVIYKTGFIRRQTVEMNMDKIESVTVTQSILGRMLNYGSIHVRGTGVGIEHLHRIAAPITLRNRIVAR
jgi:Bacterial PH domain/GYF domain 2